MTEFPELEDQLRLVLMASDTPLAVEHLADEVGETLEASSCRCRCGNRHTNTRAVRPTYESIGSVLKRLERHGLVVRSRDADTPDLWHWAAEQFPDRVPEGWR